MTRGPKPKSVAIHRLEGTFQPSRHARREVELQAPGDLRNVRPPRWMTRRQKWIWKETLADAPPGILRRIDRQFFMQWVELAAS
jgi:hypothetical protein